MPLVQIILLSAVTFAVLAAIGVYLHHLYRGSPLLQNEARTPLPIHHHHSELTVVYDALALTPCAVCCMPVGEEPMQRTDGRWCCTGCAGIPADDDEIFLLAGSVLMRFEHGLIPAREGTAQANVIRTALRAGTDAQTRQREMLAVLIAYQMLVDRIKQEPTMSPRVRAALEMIHDTERLMGLDGGDVVGLEPEYPHH